MSRMGEIIRGSGTGVSRESGRSSPLRRATPQLSMRLGHYTLGFAGTEEELREAQRLRFKVFADEFGAEICPGVPGHDIDYYDDFCDHLIVRDLDAGSGGVITLLWAGLADYMVRNNYDYLMGCASIGMADGGHNAANVYRSLDAQFRAPQEYSTFPLNRLPIERLGNDQDAVIPPLIKGYVRAGAWICGEPAWDPQFNCADVLVLMPMSQIGPRYARRFLHSGE